MGNWIDGNKDKDDKNKGDHTKPTDSTDDGHDGIKKPPIDPAEVSCEKKSNHVMHCMFLLTEKQHESLDRAGELRGESAVNLTKVGIIGASITLIVLMGAFILILWRLKGGRGGGSGFSHRHNLKTGNKSVKSKMSGKHHSSIGGGGSSKKSGKGSNLKSKKSAKSLSKSSSKKK